MDYISALDTVSTKNVKGLYQHMFYLTLFTGYNDLLLEKNVYIIYAFIIKKFNLFPIKFY